MRTLPLVVGLLLSLLGLERGQAATLADFGYQKMKVNGVPALGTRSLLVILVTFDQAPPLAHSPAYYDDLIFNGTAPTRVNNYFLEVSDQHFSWSRAGVLSVSLPASQKSTNFMGDLRDQLFASNAIHQAIASTGFNLAPFDLNNDGFIAQVELQALVITNEGETGGANRDAGCIRPPGSTKTFCAGAVALLNHQTDFATLCHELSHSLGTLDLYGVWNQEQLNHWLTLMSATITSVENPEIYHLDPWHKMQLGWVEPRIYSIRDGGVATIPAAQWIDPTTPVLLFDPSLGTSEFFLLEYRADQLVGGGLNDAGCHDNGLVIWRVKQDGARNPVLVPRVDFGSIPGQKGWRWCKKCQGLHYVHDPAAPTLQPCPAGANHVQDDSAGYMPVVNNPAASGQHGWRWCQKCSSLFYGPGQAASRCAAGGTHDGTTSGDYALVSDDRTAPGQKDWKWCRKCQSLFYGPFESQSRCPAGAGHDGAQSSSYAIFLEGQNYVLWAEGAPGFERGGSRVWRSGTVTPSLRWLDGSDTRTRLFVRPFATGAASIVVEWMRDIEIWADFSWPFTGTGTFDNPYRSLRDAAEAAPHGGTVTIKSSVGSETLTIGKRLMLQSYGGPVLIGR